ncbi:hypothetical protein JR325_gp102 [Escherichia phage tuntematon]|uniref:Uncharacterized protein n=1 Tax=Escherichia phage tuntematon TaxID=2696455 RepID=A0A6B9X604_9CAUD|nr:hypothetical protein JR325_gp102 [Escherichia phage tuntematon]QHR71958.1 hypothetical protein tuntematon_102 [Escherichia phage tuntematon]HCJ8320371.1 hypothetical protein [Escherichia coli]
MYNPTGILLKLTVTDPTLFTKLASGEVYEVMKDDDGWCYLCGYFLCDAEELESIVTKGFYEEPGFRVETTQKPDTITLTRQELITIIEDAFIDGWNTQDNDWGGPEAFLEHHKAYGEFCETTVALDNLKEGL